MDRPRLSAAVSARRHVDRDGARVILHALDGRALAVGDREWRVLAAMDGSRDLLGIAFVSGVGRDVVAEFVHSLEGHGLLETGDGPSDPTPPSRRAPNAFAPDRPVRALPLYRFRCDGSGGCCRMFATVAFTPLEAARARAACPTVLDGGRHPREAFLPHAGLDETLLAVAMRDGACAYLDADRRCGIHAAAGASQKPFGCRSFPARYVDTGEEIRVAPRPECACVFDDASDGVPLTMAARGSDLPRETFVPRLPERVRLGGATVDTRRFVAWCDALELPDADDADLAAWCDARADELGGDPAPPDPLAPIAALAASAERLARQHADWRTATDLVRRTTDWLADAARRLLDEPEPPPNALADERLYVCAALFLGAIGDGPSVEAGLRRLALHLRVARAFSPEARTEPAARQPIAIVEALARGHGVRP